MADMQIVSAYNNVEAQYVEMRVPLYSYGCEKKVKKALSNLKGIYSVDVDYYEQKVTVWGICNKNDVLANIKNKRREARFWNSEDNVDEVAKKHQTKPPPPPPSSLCRRKSSGLPLALIRAQSLSWKAWKKVFVRSNSF